MPYTCLFSLVVFFFVFSEGYLLCSIFMVCSICPVLAFLTMAKISSLYLFHSLSVSSVLLVTDCVSRFCTTAFARKVYSGDPIDSLKVVYSMSFRRRIQWRGKG